MAKILTPIRIDEDILKQIEFERTRENRNKSNMIETLLLEAIAIRTGNKSFQKRKGNEIES